VSVCFRKFRFIVATCSTKSVYCRHLYDDDLLLSKRVPRGLVSVGTCSARSRMCRDVLDEVFLVHGLVRRGLVSVRTFSGRSA